MTPVIIVTALWLGILTSISPCPLATNIAAISFIGRKLDKSAAILGAGLWYTIGRVSAYVGIGVIVITSVLSISYLSNFLQLYLNKLLGPILIVTGMFLLELLAMPFLKGGVSEKLQQRIGGLGWLGAGLLGFLFGLTFCPVSAALFFGSLIPLAVQAQSKVLLPTIFGVGTALPVLVVSFLLAFGARSIGQFFTMASRFERYARVITGILFIIIGVYFSLRYIFALI